MKSVYILGAGCSAKYYPLARDFREELRNYRDELGKQPTCVRLEQCVAETVSLMEEYRSPTIDRLIVQIVEDSDRHRAALLGHALDKHNQLQRIEDEKILNAKIATTAF